LKTAIVVLSLCCLSLAGVLLGQALSSGEEPPPAAGGPDGYGDPLAGVNWSFVFQFLDQDRDHRLTAVDLESLARGEEGSTQPGLSPGETERILRWITYVGGLAGDGPAPGDPAPDVSVIRAGDGKPVPLSSCWRDRPALLLFGSGTCPNAETFVEMAREAEAELAGVRLVVVYVREAHSSESVGFPALRSDRGEPSHVSERVDRARAFAPEGESGAALVVDGLDDRAARAYGGWPTRYYLVGTDGRIRHRSGRMPDLVPIIEYITVGLPKDLEEARGDLPEDGSARRGADPNSPPAAAGERAE